MYIYNQFPKVVAMRCSSYGLPQSDQIEYILKTIANNSADKLLVFDKSDGPVDNELEYIDWIESLNLNRDYIIVTANYNYHFTKHPKIVHYPRYFFTMLKDINTVVPDITGTRPYKISCLNRNPWIHKSINLLAMRKQPWFDQVQLSFGVEDPQGSAEISRTDLTSIITAEDAEYLQQVYPIVLPFNEDRSKFESNACPTYQNCYADYAPESRHNQPFISEKTWKPIFSGQFFFILGPCGIVEYLRAIGIDVFDDLIDHSYDTEPDLNAKISILMSSITKFLDNNLDQLWINTLARRKKNLDLVYDPEFQQLMLANLFSRVS